MLVGRTVLLTQTQRYSGHKNELYLVSGEDEPPEGGFSFSDKHKPSKTKRGLYTRLTQLSCLGFIYDTVDPKKRIYTDEEVRDVLPFVTKHNWSLENMYCRSGRERTILSAKGPSALTRGQVMSSVVCNIVGTALTSLFVIGVLVWVNAGTLFYAVAAIICCLCCLWPMVRSSAAMVKMYSDINEEDAALLDEEAFADEEDVGDTAAGEEGAEKEEGAEDDGEKKEKRTMFQLYETTRVTQPKAWVCQLGVLLQFVFFFLWPLCTLFISGNFPVGVVFLIVAIFSFLRKYFDPAAILSELGSMNDIDVEKEPGEQGKRMYPFAGFLKGPDKTLVLKARLADIVGNITRSSSVGRWMWFFGTLVVLVFLLFLQAVQSDDGLGERPPIVLVDNYYYPGEQSLQYPTCEMSKGFKIGPQDTALGDYAFLSALAYETTNVTGYLLPQWFGEGAAVDEDEFVAQWRAESSTAENPIYFKLISFPPVPDLALVAIRGSQTSWDWMVNMQLWSAAGLAQLVKWMTPYGWIWTPVLDEVSSLGKYCVLSGVVCGLVMYSAFISHTL